jgi:hypothetical protein
MRKFLIVVAALIAGAGSASCDAMGRAGECWGPPGDDMCGTYAEVEEYKKAYKKGADCSKYAPTCSGAGCPSSAEKRRLCENYKAGKFDK